MHENDHFWQLDAIAERLKDANLLQVNTVWTFVSHFIPETNAEEAMRHDEH